MSTSTCHIQNIIKIRNTLFILGEIQVRLLSFYFLSSGIFLHIFFALCPNFGTFDRYCSPLLKSTLFPCWLWMQGWLFHHAAIQMVCQSSTDSESFFSSCYLTRFTPELWSLLALTVSQLNWVSPINLTFCIKFMLDDFIWWIKFYDLFFFIIYL